MMRLAIAELYPYEPSVLRSTVQKYLKAYQANPSSVERPKVALIDGCWIVKNGTNRVFAAKEAGLTEIDVLDDTPTFQQYQIAQLSLALAQAQEKNQQGFANIPVDDTMSERQQRY